MTITREQIIAWANQAKLGTTLSHGHEERVWIEGADWHSELEAFAILVASPAPSRPR